MQGHTSILASVSVYVSNYVWYWVHGFTRAGAKILQDPMEVAHH